MATGDVNGDGKADIITGAGPGGGPHVQVFSGTDGSILRSFMAYDPRFTGGIFVAAADINGDGKADIITGAGPGGGPHVQVFSGANGSVLWSFMAYDPRFTGGIFVTTGDINGDGVPDIITGAGPGGGPHVQVFSGTDGSILRSFMAYDPRFAGGIFVASGDINGDGKADIITGAGPGGGPHVQVFSGTDGSVLRSFMAYDPRFTGGIFVASGGIAGSVGVTGTSSSIIAGSFAASAITDSTSDPGAAALTAVPTAAETGATLTTGSGPGQSVPAGPGNAFATSARAQARRSPAQGSGTAESSPRVVAAWRRNTAVPPSQRTSPSGWDSLIGALLPDVTSSTPSLAPGTRKAKEGISAHDLALELLFGTEPRQVNGRDTNERLIPGRQQRPGGLARHDRFSRPSPRSMNLYARAAMTTPPSLVVPYEHSPPRHATSCHTPNPPHFAEASPSGSYPPLRVCHAPDPG